ncbi:MAG: ribosomal protein S18-alanine N-acetyltransferase [Porticoccaceae bacterium]|nr:ribosomal protein S18-alanine N-acetyltransferase [Porticoccaceae bacterium]
MNLGINQQYSIRGMEIADLEQVVGIEKHCSPSPWSLKQFQQSLDDSMVLVTAGTIVGFSVVDSILSEAEIHNVAVHPDYQGQGLGSLLLDHVVDCLPPATTKLHLEVRASNFRAIRLYLHKNFIQVGERRDYYKTEYGREDALLMSRSVCTGRE